MPMITLTAFDQAMAWGLDPVKRLVQIQWTGLVTNPRWVMSSQNPVLKAKSQNHSLKTRPQNLRQIETTVIAS
jgi:hypothetical protein